MWGPGVQSFVRYKAGQEAPCHPEATQGGGMSPSAHLLVLRTWPPQPKATVTCSKPDCLTVKRD